MTVKIAKYVSLAALAVAAVATTASCSREEDDIWDRSAAERLDDARNTDLATLCAAQNGWEMLYFTANDNVSRGLNFLMKFNTDGSVTIAAKNSDTGNDYTEETSTFDVISDDGPVLTFNTYNNLFHRYADPDPEHTQVDSDGVGDGGDYEFKIMSINNDMIYMRGKKHGLEVYMHRLADDVNWEQYFTDVEAMHERMFTSSIPTLWLTLADGSRYSITNAATQEMSLVRENGDAITETTKLSYVATRTGMRWIRSYSGHDNESATPAREFVFNAEGTYLVSTDFGGGTAGATIKAPVFADLFADKTTWRIDLDSFGDGFVTVFQNMSNSLLETNRVWKVNYIELRPNVRIDSSHALRLRLGTSNCDFYYSVDTTGETAKIVFSGSANAAGETVLKRVPEVQNFLDLLEECSFAFSSESELIPSYMTLVDVSASDKSFNIELR